MIISILALVIGAIIVVGAIMHVMAGLATYPAFELLGAFLIFSLISSIVFAILSLDKKG